MVTAYGWRTSFILFGIFGLVWALVWWVWFRDSPGEKHGVSKEELVEIGDVPRTGSHQGLPWGRALRSPNLWWIMLMYHTYCWGSFFYLSWLVTFLVKGRGFTEGEIKTLSWLPFAFGGAANLLGGIVSDALVRRVGLRWGRRLVGLIGLGASALFITATIFTQDKVASLVLLAFGYAGSDFMLPVAWAVCLDVGRKYAGAVTGAMNTAGQIGSFLTSVAFGYIVTGFGSYNAPLVPMAVMTAISALLWLKIDPAVELIPEQAHEPLHRAA